MNKYSFLAAMALVTMASCSNNQFDEDGPAIAKSETPIIVKTGVSTKSALDTKASIGTGDNVTAMFALINKVTAAEAADWAGFTPRTENTLTDGALATYNTDAANVATGTFVANPTTAQVISFQPTLYYDKTANMNHYMVGVAPVGTVKTGGTVEFTTKDGEQDVMYAGQIDKGTKDDAETNSNTFEFNHMTGQVSFKVKKDATVGDDVVTVKSIKLKTVRLPKSIALANGTVTYDTPADLALPNVISSQAVTTAGVETGNPVMVAPMTTLSIDAVVTIAGVDKTYSNVPVTFTGALGGTGITQGYSSEVTINVKKTTSTETAIEASATVVAWKTGNTGNVDLD
ncbi:hypothetical protein [Parabacteroides sp.]